MIFIKINVLPLIRLPITISGRLFFLQDFGRVVTVQFVASFQDAGNDSIILLYNLNVANRTANVLVDAGLEVNTVD